ncbi:CRTAC1 family protein, partial [bacterium]|nr:CRTAC1 family protein [bacterium]
IFADYDNDGFLDLFIANSERNLLYRNVAEGRFQDFAASAGVAQFASALAVEFIDLDHDGDLDLFSANNGLNRAFRNNLDGTFAEHSGRMGIAGHALESRDIGFADFDNDIDLDVLVVNADGSNAYYRNLRRGFFQEMTAESGIAGDTGSSAVAVGDYDNDGFQDLFFTSASGQRFRLYRNKGDGTFEADTRSNTLFQQMTGTNGQDTKFLDFDNDGFLDLLVVGEPTIPNPGRSSVFLFRNDGTGKFEDKSGLLPDNLQTAKKISLADYNEDGDLDIFLITQNGEIRLLRNDGGNANKWLKIRLRGLRTGSGKNNHFGIGAKIEVRAGDLYQVRVVDNPVTHFGLGQRLKADVVRILWTNGVPENLFFPGSDQDLVEQQTLKGSCAFLYAWNGENYEFVTDVMWRSALGMPSGIMAGKTAYAPAQSSNDYFRIPGESLRERNGIYELRLTEELWETAYFDQLRLIALDHPAKYEVYINERLAPSTADFPRIYTISEKQLPKSAFDDQGHNLLTVIAERDHRYVSTFILGRHQGLTETHDLVLDLGDLSTDDNLLLFL